MTKCSPHWLSIIVLDEELPMWIASKKTVFTAWKLWDHNIQKNICLASWKPSIVLDFLHDKHCERVTTSAPVVDEHDILEIGDFLDYIHTQGWIGFLCLQDLQKKQSGPRHISSWSSSCEKGQFEEECPMMSLQEVSLKNKVLQCSTLLLKLMGQGLLQQPLSFQTMVQALCIFWLKLH